MDANPPLPGRRPLKTRGQAWAKALAAKLVDWRITPNRISVISVVWAAVAAGALAFWPQAEGSLRPLLLVVAAVGIQMRLLCNMLDGMVAVEGGLRSPTGDLFNEVPDRISDTLILVAVGIGLRGLPYAECLGWSAALLAMLTAYVRAIGASLGQPRCFHGPMAKPHRMALLTAASLATALCAFQTWSIWILWVALVVVVIGSAVTTVRRLQVITRHLCASSP